MHEDNAAAGITFKDRKAGLVVFGIFEILFGLMCLLGVLFMAIGMGAAAALEDGPAASLSVGGMIPSLVINAVLAVWFVWMGMGSILARRWARTLWLVSSWLWLVVGMVTLIGMAIWMPDMLRSFAPREDVPRNVATLIIYVTMGVVGVLYVLVPGLLVLFYGSRHVKATCERRDPKPRWTDRCPPPVLAVSFAFAGWAVCMPFMGLYGWAFPFFGTIVSGPSGAAVSFLSFLLCGAVAWGVYRLRGIAWWGAAGLLTAWGASSVLTFSRIRMMDLYEKMLLPADQVALIAQHSPVEASAMIPFTVGWVILSLAYLLFVRRFFHDGQPSAE